MSIITRFLAVVTEPQFKLARDLTAMAIADGQVTPEEKEAMSTICHLEGIDENKLMEALRGGYDKVNEEMPNSRQEKEVYLRDIIKLIGADGYSAPQEVYLFQIIASRMGLNQMDVIGLFLLTATRQYFKGDAGARILASFLKNYIDQEILRQNLARATEVFLENKILIKEFADVGLDFSIMARQEEQNVFKKYVSS